MLAVLLDDLQVVFHAWLCFAIHGFQHHLGEPQDGGQRGAQLVADIGQKRLFELIHLAVVALDLNLRLRRRLRCACRKCRVSTWALNRSATAATISAASSASAAASVTASAPLARPEYEWLLHAWGFAIASVFSQGRHFA